MAKRSSGSGGNRHVVRDGKNWAVKKPGTATPVSRHRTQGAAEREANRQVGREGGGEVRIHGRDGRIRDSDTVPPGRDPNPPKDRKH
jgi:hypothetical protein